MNLNTPTTIRRSLPTLLLALGLLAGCTTWANTVPEVPSPTLQSIPSLEVPRYMGTWHEIAKYPNRFQKHCASHTQARYRLLPDGGVEVINRCRTGDGDLSEALGMARQVGAADSARLKVRFAPQWLSFLPWVWGDYWVIDLDPDYQLVAISEPTREYLWVLSRTPTIDEQAYRQLLERLEAQGFELERLERTVQTDE
ncbi:MAG: lipocalin family protein [Rhodocyclaceae bacterium]